MLVPLKIDQTGNLPPTYLWLVEVSKPDELLRDQQEIPQRLLVITC
jgi:hypothetical protein